MENDLTHRTKRLKQCHHRPIFKQRRAKVQFADVPEDLMCTVFSKMPLKDVVRTSVLSSKWRRMWTCCTKLRFDGVKVSTDNVSAVLQQHSGKIIEEFKVLTLLENPLKFSHLKYLHLWLTIVFEDASHILSISSFLRAAPCVKMLEIHFDVHTFSHVDYLDHLRGLPGCNHFYLRNLRITGFVGSTGQFELLIHIVENASILEDLTIETAGTFRNDLDYEGRLKVEERTRKHLRGIMLPYTKLYVS